MQHIKNIMDQVLKNKVLKAGIGFTIASLLLRAIGFLSTPVFSRLMDPSEYGVYNTYLAYEGIFYIIVGFALHSSIQNAMYEFKGHLDEYISSILIIDIISVFTWLVLANIFSGQISKYVGFNRTLINILILHSFSSAIIQVLQSRLSVDYNYRNYLWVSLASAIGNVVISIVLILSVCASHKDVGRVYGNFIPVFIISIITCGYFFKRATPRFNQQYWKFGLKFSLPIIPHGISQIILNQFDRIMIRNSVSDAAAGLYSFAYSLSGISATITTALQTAYTPWFYSRMDERTEEAYVMIKKRSSQYAILLVCYAGAIMLISPELLKIMGPDSYRSAKYACIPILMGCFFSTLYSIPIQVEYYYKKTNYIAATTCTIAILNIILNAMFIPKYGYIAAAYTTLISYILYFIFHYFMAKKIHGSDLFDVKTIVMVSIVSLVLGILSLIFIEAFFVRVFGIVIIGFIGIDNARKYFAENS